MNCLDSYALVEIHKGNPKYSFLMKEEFAVTDLTLAEFYGLILKEHNETTAVYITNKFLGSMCHVSFDILKKAIVFKRQNREKNISFFDAQGYIFAKEKGHKFVTGDKEFRNMKGVLFVK